MHTVTEDQPQRRREPCACAKILHRWKARTSRPLERECPERAIEAINTWPTATTLQSEDARTLGTPPCSRPSVSICPPARAQSFAVCQLICHGSERSVCHDLPRSYPDRNKSSVWLPQVAAAHNKYVALSSSCSMLISEVPCSQPGREGRLGIGGHGARCKCASAGPTQLECGGFKAQSIPLK